MKSGEENMNDRIREILSWYVSENPGVRTNLAIMGTSGSAKRRWLITPFLHYRAYVNTERFYMTFKMVGKARFEYEWFAFSEDLCYTKAANE